MAGDKRVKRHLLFLVGVIFYSFCEVNLFDISLCMQNSMLRMFTSNTLVYHHVLRNTVIKVNKGCKKPHYSAQCLRQEKFGFE